MPRLQPVQGAQQALTGALLIPLMLLQIVPIVLMSLMPNGRELINQMLKVDFVTVVSVLSGVLLLLNALAAAAIGWQLGVAPETIAATVTTMAPKT